MTEKIQSIPARIKNIAKGGHVAGTEDIIDDASGKTQKEINTETGNKVNALQKQDIEVVTSLPAVGSADPKKIYRVAGETSYTDYMLNAAESQFVSIATYSFPGIDDEPTAGSEELVKSGGVSKKIYSLSLFKDKVETKTYQTVTLYDGYLDAQGNVVESSNRKVTDYISIADNTQTIQIVKSYQTAAGNCCACFYDKEKQFLSKVNYGETSEDVNLTIRYILPQYKYIRVNFNDSQWVDLKTRIVIQYKEEIDISDIENFVDKTEPYFKNDSNNIPNRVFQLEKQSFSYKLLFVNGTYNDNGAYIPNSSNRIISNSVYNESFTIKVKDDYYVYRVAIVNENGTFNSWYDNNPYLYADSFEFIPDGTHGCRVVVIKRTEAALTPEDDFIESLVAQETIFERVKTLENEVYNLNTYSKLANKKIFCLGSSSTQASPMYNNKAYPEWVAQWHKANVTNLGRGGATLIADPNASANIYNWAQYIATDADYVTIMIGANDVLSSVVTFEDNGQMTDFISAFRYLIESITIRVAKATIGLIIPYKAAGMGTGPYAENYEKVKQTIINMGKDYALQVLDVGEAGFNGIYGNDDVTQFSSDALAARVAALTNNNDGSHLNAVGMEKMARVIDGFINIL